MITAEVGNPMYIVAHPGTLFKTDQVRYVDGAPAILADVEDEFEISVGKVVTRISMYKITDLPDNLMVTGSNVFGNICDEQLNSNVLVIEMVEPHLLAETDNIISLLTDTEFDAKAWVSEEIH